MARLILGKHPQGPAGLFISKPGVAVESTAPTDANNLLFSSEWGNICNIVQAGTCGLNEDVTIRNLGYRPYVRIEDGVGNAYSAGTPFGRTVSVGNGTSRRYDWTRYMISYTSNTVFRVVKRYPTFDTDTPSPAPGFRYVVLNFPVNA